MYFSSMMPGTETTDCSIRHLIWCRYKKWLARKLIVNAYRVQGVAHLLRNLADKIDPPPPEAPQAQPPGQSLRIFYPGNCHLN